MAEIDKQINSREVIERKRKEFEEKYGDKLKKRVERCVWSSSHGGAKR